MSYPTNNIKWTIGGPEAPIGTAAARTVALPIRGLPSFTRKPGRVRDPVIKGDSMDCGDYLAFDSAEGGIPLSPRAGAAFGKILKSLMGTETAPAQVAACIRVRYTGVSASCKIIADTGANTLRALTGAVGAEVNDAGWNGGNPLDLTAVPSDTVGEVVALADGYANFDCEKVFGDNATSAGLIVSDAAGQAKNQWCYLWFTSVGSGAYYRSFTLDRSTTERPAYTIQADGYADQMLYNGCISAALTLDALLKGIVEADADILGFTESLGTGASVVTMADLSPLFFWNGSFTLGAVTFPYIRRLNLKIDNASNKEGYGQGSVSRMYQAKGYPIITGEVEIPLDAALYAQRANVFSSTSAYGAMSFYFKGKDIGANVNLPEMMIVELPFVQPTAFEYIEGNNIWYVKLAFKGILPKGTVYDEPLTIHLVSADAAAY